MISGPGALDMGGEGAAESARDAVALVAAACASGGARPALIFEDGIELSYQGLADRAAVFAGFLRDRVRPGERVAIAVGNRAEFMIAWIAAMARGVAMVPINTSARIGDATHVLRDSRAVLAIADKERWKLLAEAARRCPDLGEVIMLAGDEPDGLSGYVGAAELPLEEAEVDPEAITNVYYTSGSTGPPKGCMVDHSYWLRFVSLYREIWGMSESDRLLTCLNFFYNDPSWHLLTALRSGTTAIAMRRFSVSRFWEVVRRFEITQLFGIASIPSLLLTAPKSASDLDNRVRFAVQVGIPSPEIHERLVDRWGFPWLELYGLTETGILTAVPPVLGYESVGSGSIGMAVPGVKLRLVGPDGDEPAGDEPGEVQVRGPGMMHGYLNQPKQTREAYAGDWFRTGDLARRDPAGMLHFAGRIKDVIRRSGENVAAAEVELVLRRHPRVADVAVVPVGDELRGEEIKAHVLLEAGADVRPAELARHCAESLAPHKVPRFIELRREDFPRTPSMRIAKPALLATDPEPRAGAWDREATGA